MRLFLISFTHFLKMRRYLSGTKLGVKGNSLINISVFSQDHRGNVNTSPKQRLSLPLEKKHSCVLSPASAPRAPTPTTEHPLTTRPPLYPRPRRRPGSTLTPRRHGRTLTPRRPGRRTRLLRSTSQSEAYHAAQGEPVGLCEGITCQQ